MFNRVSLAILHYRLHERIHCRPENSRLQLEYSLAIFFCPGRLPGAEYESTGSTGDVQPRASFAVRSREKKKPDQGLRIPRESSEVQRSQRMN